MIGYFDSSVLLHIALGQDRASRALELCQATPIRVSSILMKIECITVVRRAGLLGATVSEAQLVDLFDGFSLKLVDSTIYDTIAAEPSLAKCRSLDAIHLATALSFAAETGERVEVFTFDERMIEAAESLRLTVRR